MGAIAQDANSWNDLVITEFRWSKQKYGSADWGYIELTNMGKDTLDLSKYWLQSAWGNFTALGMTGVAGKATVARFPGHKLLPGEVFTWVLAQQNDVLDRYGNRVYPNDWANIQAVQRATYVNYARLNFDGNTIMRENQTALFCRADTNMVPDGVADSARVDMLWYEDKQRDVNVADSNYPIAGIITGTPHKDYIYIRKFKFKHGNTDFTQSRGNSVTDSEWQAIPRDLAPNDVMYTTFGSHKESQDLDLTPKLSSISIDMNKMEISVPFDIAKDSIFRRFNYGPNHAWEFVQGPDTTSWYVSNGDSVIFYTVGNELKSYKFGFKVAEKPQNFAKVYPIIVKNENGTFVRRYVVSDGYSPMDTIGQIRFNEPVDTLLKYVGHDVNATVEFIWVDGIARPEVKDGDILRITSGANSKDYKLGVWPYTADPRSGLTAIIFPGLAIWENPNTFEYTDTLPGFKTAGTFYVVNLPQDVTQSPAVIPVPQSPNAKVYVSRAKNLSGSEEERTITISVMAEDDSTYSEYKLLLNIERETPPVVGEPFMTDIAGYWRGNGATALQIFNPSDEVIYASDYAIFHITTPDFNSWIDGAIWKDKSWKDLNKQLVRPGSYMKADINGDPYFIPDNTVTNLELDPREEWCAMGAASWPSGEGSNISASEELRNQVDMLWGAYGVDHNHLRGTKAYWQARWSVPYPYGDPEQADYTGQNKGWLPMASLSFPRFNEGPTYALFKIKNDSIKDGTKPVFKNFYDDYELVDIANGVASTKVPWKMYYKAPNGQDSLFDVAKLGDVFKNGNIYRHPRVYTGNPIDLASFGSPGKEGEWIPYGIEFTEDGVYKVIQQNNDKGDLGTVEFGRSRFKNHTMVTAAHISYLTSKVYLVSKGLSNNETILGVNANTSVDAFMNNIIKADDGMSVVVKSALGIVKEGADILVQGDKVSSTAANGLTSVTYTVSVGTLDSNTTLAVKAGAGFDVAGTVIQNVPFGISVKDFLSNLEAPATASMMLTDGKDYVIPNEIWPSDTNAVTRVDASLMSSYVVEVNAQDGVHTAKYSISFKDENDVFITSDVYTINQELKQLNYVRSISVANFLAGIIASPGAEAIVVNKFGQKREMGIIQYHDRILVTKGDVSVTYWLKFMNEVSDEVAVETVKKSAISIYPNPATANIVISGLAKATDLRIVNLSGQLVKTVKVSGETMSLNLNLNSGIYFVSVMNNNTTIETSKVVIE